MGTPIKLIDWMISQKDMIEIRLPTLVLILKPDEIIYVPKNDLHLKMKDPVKTCCNPRPNLTDLAWCKVRHLASKSTRAVLCRHLALHVNSTDAPKAFGCIDACYLIQVCDKDPLITGLRALFCAVWIHHRFVCLVIYFRDQLVQVLST